MFRICRRLPLIFRCVGFSKTGVDEDTSATLENLSRSRDEHCTRRLASSMHRVLTSSESWSRVTPSCAISVLTALADAGVRVDGISKAAKDTLVTFLPVLSVCELSLLMYACHTLGIDLPPEAVREVVVNGCASVSDDEVSDPSDVVRLLYFGEMLMAQCNGGLLPMTLSSDPQPLHTSHPTENDSCRKIQDLASATALASSYVVRNASKLFLSAALQALELAAVRRHAQEACPGGGQCTTAGNDEHSLSLFVCDGATFQKAVLPVLVQHLTCLLRHDPREIPSATVAFLLRMVGRNRGDIIDPDFFSTQARKQLSEVCFQLIHTVLPHVALATVVELAAAVDEVSDEFSPLLLKRTIAEYFDERWEEINNKRPNKRATEDLSTEQVLLAFHLFPHRSDRLWSLLEESDRLSEMGPRDVVAILRLFNASSQATVVHRVHTLVDPLLAQIFVIAHDMDCDECCFVLKELDALKSWIEAPAPLIKKVKRQFYSTFSAKEGRREGADRRMLLFTDGHADAAASEVRSDRTLHPLEALKLFVTSIRRFHPVLPSDREGLIEAQRLLCDWGLRSSCPDVHETLAVLGARYDPFVC